MLQHYVYGTIRVFTKYFMVMNIIIKPCPLQAPSGELSYILVYYSTPDWCTVFLQTIEIDREVQKFKNILILLQPQFRKMARFRGRAFPF